MNTISLYDAYKKMEKFKAKKLDIISGIIYKKKFEYQEELNNAEDLYMKIVAAEKASGLDSYKDSIALYDMELEFYSLDNLNKYYKDYIDNEELKEIRELVKETKALREDAIYFLQERAKKVFIEI